MGNGPDIDRYWETLAGALPTFTEEQRHAAIALYRALALGSPVTRETFAEAAGLSLGEAEELLAGDPIRAFVYADERGRVAGFGGLATAPMHHELRLQGRTLWTWCAWDSLFLPEILAEAGLVVSRDPLSGTEIRLSVGPEGVRTRDPKTTVVSFVRTDSSHFSGSAANVMGNFCHYVFFFEDRASGEAWSERHDGTFLVSLDEAVDLARRMNRRTWGDALRAPVP